MHSNSILKDIFNVMSSNFLLLISSIITGLIIPMVLGATNYGYYRTFTLYMTYTGLLPFGFVEGIILCYGGKRFNDLNKKEFRTNSLFFIVFQFFVSFLLFFFISFFISSLLNKIIIILVGVDSFLINVTVYYQCIAQSIMRFSELSFRKSCQALIMIILTILLWLLYIDHIIYNADCLIYIFVIIFSDLVLFIWYMFSYRSLTFGKRCPLKLDFHLIITYFKKGVYLSFSSQMSTMILIVDNQFVSILFTKSDYGKYSFANSMSTSVLTLLSAVSVVLLPHLKQLGKYKAIEKYPEMLSYMLLIVLGSLLGYFPLYELVNIILPKYIISLQYFRFFLPGVSIACCIIMIICNYYSILNKGNIYFYISVVTLILAVILDYFAFIFTRNLIILSFASMSELFIWYIISNRVLENWYNIKNSRNLIYMLLTIVGFIFISYFPNLILDFIIYLLFYIVASYIILHKYFINILKRIYNIL